MCAKQNYASGNEYLAWTAMLLMFSETRGKTGEGGGSKKYGSTFHELLCSVSGIKKKRKECAVCMVLIFHVALAVHAMMPL